MLNRLYQNHRARLLVIYIAGLIAINYLLFEEVIPTGLWFWSAFLTFLLSALLSQPYFTAPRDALANAFVVIGAVVSTLTAQSLGEVQQVVWRISFGVALSLLFIALLAMVFRDSDVHKERIYARISTHIARLFGSPRVVFSALFFLTLYTFHSESASTVFWLSLTWVSVVVGRPLEHLSQLYIRIAEIRREEQQDAHVVGHVEFRRYPGLITINVTAEAAPKVGKLVMVPTDEQNGELGLILDNYKLSGGLWARAIVFAENVPKSDFTCGWSADGTVLGCTNEQVKSKWLDNEVYCKCTDLVGSVIERSDISLVRIEQYREDSYLAEGRLLSLKINGTDVLYQIINGETRSEALEESNRHGFTTIEARKLGQWNESSRRFEAVPWIPEIHSAVYALKQSESARLNTDYIGFIPNTEYGVSVDSHKLVTHNTAILGILGSGKTSLALELIKHVIQDNIKVWVIDITGQYEPAIGNLIHKEKQEKADQEIMTKIKESERSQLRNKADGGNHKEFAKEILIHIKKFMKDETWRVRVFNPGKYVVTEQTSGLFNNEAGIGTMTSSQITRIVAEEMLRCLQDKMSEDARLCLVLEEAHSLVPEWNSVAFEGDAEATNGTAKAILQGRKYGLGCLLITQRTANVTKSILNQCNTVFGLKVFDATGIDFLSNYIGTDYANVLATLPDRQCVAFGSALNAQFPLILELNDRDVFESGFTITKEAYMAQDSDGNSDHIRGGEEEPSESPDDKPNYPDAPASVDDLPF